MVAYVKRRIGKPLNSELFLRYGIPPDVLLHGTVAIWSGYSHVPVRQIREQKSYELVHLVTAYTLRFDAIVDNHQGMAAFIGDSKLIKAHPDLRTLASAMGRWIAHAPFSIKKKLLLANTVQEYRYVALLTAYRRFLEFQLRGGLDISDAFASVEQINGHWGRTLAKIINIVHDIPPDVGKRIEWILHHFMVAGQFCDDPFDFKFDVQTGSPNLVAAILKEHPEEAAYVATLFSRDESRWGWLPNAAPLSYSRVKRLFIHELTQLMAVDSTSPMVRRLSRLSVAFFRLAVVQKTIPRFLEVIWARVKHLRSN